MLSSVQLGSSIQPVSRCFTNVDRLWIGRQVTLGVLLVAHGLLAWRNVVVVQMPFSDLFELYPWELGIVVLFTGVGLFELHCAAWELGIVVLCAGVGLVKLHLSSCDLVPDVRSHDVVEVLELVNEVLWIVFVSFVFGCYR